MIKRQCILSTFIVVGCFVSSATKSDEDRSWHLLTQSYGGSVTLIKDLTKHECEFSRARVLGNPATPEEEADERKRYVATHPPCPGNNGIASENEWKTWRTEHIGAEGCTYGYGVKAWDGVSNSYIKSAECFQ